MKYVAIILAVVTLAAVCLGLYAWMNTSLQVVASSMTALSGTEADGRFEQMRTALDNQALLGTVFKTGQLGDKDEYTLYVINVQMKNNGLLPAEMVELQLSPAQEDVAVAERAMFLSANDSAYIVINPGETQNVQLLLLTKKTTSAPVRTMYATYYVWGNPLSVKFTHGA